MGSQTPLRTEQALPPPDSTQYEVTCTSLLLSVPERPGPGPSSLRYGPRKAEVHWTSALRPWMGKIHSLQLAFPGKQVIVQFLLCLSELYLVTYPPNTFTQHKSFSLQYWSISQSPYLHNSHRRLNRRICSFFRFFLS